MAENNKGKSYWIYGQHAVQAALANDARKIERLVASTNAVKELNLAGRKLNADTDIRQLDKILPKDAVHQGVAALVHPLPHTTLDDVLESTLLLVLDQVTDPHNVGAILRTCAAAGIKRVFASVGTAGLWSPKVLRSAQGAHFVLKLHEQIDLMALTEALAIPLIVTTLEDAKDLYKTALPKQAAWVFGNEGQGVTDSLLSRADIRVKIIHDKAVESLNVTVASGVCLFEQRRQHSADK
jgi:TrmH family RNA methyltransferase